jgi:hypothetical protein
MRYRVKIIGQGFETVYDTLDEAEEEADRIAVKVPYQKENIYIDELTTTEIQTGSYYKYDTETKQYKRCVL